MSYRSFRDCYMKILLGPEYDQQLRVALGRSLSEIKARRVWHFWGVGGSQQVEVWWYVVSWRLIRIVAETYMGVFAHGPPSVLGPLDVSTRKHLAILRQHEGHIDVPAT
jgi:hypothetical protein